MLMYCNVFKNEILIKGEFCSLLRRKSCRNTADLESTERVNHPHLAWSARFPFLAKADDVCTAPDDSIDVTCTTRISEDFSLSVLMKDKGSIDILSQFAECNYEQVLEFNDRDITQYIS